MRAGAERLDTAVKRVSDLVAVGLTLAGAYWFRFESGFIETPEGAEPLVAHLLTPLPVALLLCALAFQACGYYRPRRPRSLWSRGRRLLRGVAVALLLLMAATFLYRGESYSRIMALTFAGALPVAIVVERLALSVALSALRARIGLRRALLVGEGPALRSLANKLRRNTQLGLEVVGRIPTAAEDPTEETDTLPDAVGSVDDLLATLARLQVEEVYLALPQDRLRELDRLLTSVPVDVRYVPDLVGCSLIRPEVSSLGGLPIITLRQGPHVGLNAVVKRGFDVAASALLIVLLAPLLLAVALAIKLTSSGSVLYRQQRVSWGGRRFAIFKFRTMCMDADSIGPTRTERDDPRRTSIGGFLRRTSLDELPQLFNVLVGDMSLVGPRPEPEGHYPDLERELPGFMLRHAVRAGMTGWAQVHGLRGDSPVSERLQMDLDYIHRWSLVLDLRILALTLIHGFVNPNAF